MREHATATHPLARQEGLTLVEVMVAMVILVVGMLGLVSMLTTGQRVTTQNLSRDGATSLAREGIERAREMAYSDLSRADTVAAALSPVLDGSAAAIGATFATRRRGVTYTTTITSCVLDDPSDGVGPAPGTPCRPLAAEDGGGAPQTVTGGSGSLLSLNVLGIPLSGSGSLVDAICSLVGRDSVLDGLIGRGGALTPLVSSGADVGVCSTNRAIALDRQPADATAVTAVVSWPSGAQVTQVTQRALVAGPRVTS